MWADDVPTARRVELRLRALTGTAVVVAAGALLWPPNVPEIDIPPAGLASPATAPPPPASEPSALRAIVAGDVFSSSRSAPRGRWRPPGLAASGASAEPASGGPASVGVPRLYGIVPGASGAAALLRLDPSVSGALLYREGDRGGRYRVDAIGEQSVVLTGPSGRIELRLAAPAGIR